MQVNAQERVSFSELNANKNLYLVGLALYNCCENFKKHLPAGYIPGATRKEIWAEVMRLTKILDGKDPEFIMNARMYARSDITDSSTIDTLAMCAVLCPTPGHNSRTVFDERISIIDYYGVKFVLEGVDEVGWDFLLTDSQKKLSEKLKATL